MIGIYCIENSINGEKYIGQSSNIDNRWKEHKRLLNKNKHYNTHLQKAWNKYGENAFIFSVVEICEESMLDEKEKDYIVMFKAFPDGYNLTAGGEGTRGYVHSEEYKQHMRSIFSGRKFSDETIQKMSLAKKGIAPKQTAKFLEGRKRVPEKLRGKRFSEEHRKHISESHKGIIPWNKGKKFPPEAHSMYGKHHSEETKRKISQANKGRKNTKEQIEKSSKPVLCVETGEIFPSISEAARKNKVSIYAISNVLRGKSRTSNSYHWKYVDKVE